MNLDMSKISPILDEMEETFTKTGELTGEQIQLLNSFGIAVDETGEKIEGMGKKSYGMAEGVVALGQTLSNVAMIANSAKGLFDTWNNEDMSFGEKLITTFTTLGTIIPMVTSTLNKNNLAKLAGFSASI
jgi:hypothetical protein